ncbi:MAG: hypothetical protein ACOCX3_00870 [Chloroflexota bacterium]
MTSLRPFTIDFSRNQARAIRIEAGISAEAALSALGVTDFTGAIVLHGGGMTMEPDLTARITAFFREGLIPFAEKHRLLVAFGGTVGGTMGALGDAYSQAAATFPLVGVCPLPQVRFPGHPFERDTPFKPLFPAALRPVERFPLAEGAPYFVFIEHGPFGIESRLISSIAGAFDRPGVGLVVNGGKIARDEVYMQADRRIPVITVPGSDRLADELANPHSAIRESLPAHAAIYAAPLDQPETLHNRLSALFTPA